MARVYVARQRRAPQQHDLAWLARNARLLAATLLFSFSSSIRCSRMVCNLHALPRLAVWRIISLPATLQCWPPLTGLLGKPAAVFILFGAPCSFALDNGLIRTPPMGWSTWNRFHCGINETLVQDMAKAMESSGLAKAGYTYVNLDDCWMAATRNASGHLQADPDTFPSGMKHLGDYIHNLGLKYGLYGDPGTVTCQRRAGNENHEKIDAMTYAEYGADYLKYDSCAASHSYQLHGYMDMRDALNATGRPIGYSICPDASRCNDANVVMWDASSVANVVMCRGDGWCRKHSAAAGNSTELGDINPTWHSWTCILDANVEFNSMRYAGPGHYVMPDMLEVGNGMTPTEDISHMSLWAMIAAPLIAGNDLHTVSSTTVDILTNSEVISVNQDPMGKPGLRVYQNDNKTAEVWSRQLHDGNYAVVLFNRDNSTSQEITLHWSYIGLPNDQPASLRDLWQHKNLGSHEGNYTSVVAPHGVVMLKAIQLPGGLGP